ncbi:flagellar biosynthetic protein FliO [Zavarzinella formosa]|uniref:flagellar biosynthetic protein FliO n=1 Tax=Zavarzinella formosa TaxID=360055 RepID=UPI00036FA3BB|nr:flagellar biosynthetic protein FliO [Zavarzinella formosa]
MRRWLILGLFAISSPVRAAGELAYTPPPMPEPPSVDAMLFRLFVWTGVLLVLCLGLFWFSRRLQRSAKPGMKSGGMEYIASVPLNRKCALHVIEANGQKIVVATDLGGIREMLPLTDSFATVLQHAEEN